MYKVDLNSDLVQKSESVRRSYMPEDRWDYWH